MPVANPFGPLDEAHGYVDPVNPQSDLRVSSLLYGLFLGICCSVLPSVIAASGFFKRPFHLSYFKVLIWCQWTVCTTFGTMLWARFQHYVAPSFGFYFMLVLLWSIQIQLLTQIACNRVGILVNDRQLKRRVKFGVFCIMLCLSIFVWVGWVPTALEVEDPIYSKLTTPFNCVVMAGIMIVDIVLNLWFVFTVKKRLIDLGLRKYDALVWLNILFLCCAVALDALTVGLMFMSNRGLYLHIYPIAYIVKLAIELSLSSLIVKIASQKTTRQVPVSGIAARNSKNDDAGLTTRIHVLVEEDVKSVLTEKVDVQPAFGQFIKRPDYAREDTDFAYPVDQAGYELDDKSSASSSYQA